MVERVDVWSHKERIAQGIYPKHMVPVIEELIAEIERLRQERDAIDGAFKRWREKART